MQSRHLNVITHASHFISSFFFFFGLCVELWCLLSDKEIGLGWPPKTGHKSTRIHKLFAEATLECFRFSVPSEPLCPTGLASLSFLKRAFERDAAELSRTSQGIYWRLLVGCAQRDAERVFIQLFRAAACFPKAGFFSLLFFSAFGLKGKGGFWYKGAVKKSDAVSGAAHLTIHTCLAYRHCEFHSMHAHKVLLWPPFKSFGCGGDAFFHHLPKSTPWSNLLFSSQNS